MADRKISDLTALTTPASGDFLPIVDISEAAAASKNKRITIEELMRGMPNGTAAAPAIAFASDKNTGIFSPGADQLAVATNGTGRLFVAADGKVGVGTSTPNGLLTVTVATAGTAADFVIGNPANLWSIKTGTTTNALTIVDTQFSAERLRIDTLGNVGIGTSSPDSPLHVIAGVVAGLRVGFNGLSENYYDANLHIIRNIAGAQNVRIGSTGEITIIDAGHITVGTTTGTKIGTATTQKIGFFDKTPVVQPTAVADATDAATAITQLNALLTRMRNLGLIAT